MIDLFHSLSTGASLLINEQEFVDTIAQGELRQNTMDESIPFQKHRSGQDDFTRNPHDTDKWMPFFR